MKIPFDFACLTYFINRLYSFFVNKGIIVFFNYCWPPALPHCFSWCKSEIYNTQAVLNLRLHSSSSACSQGCPSCIRIYLQQVFIKLITEVRFYAIESRLSKISCIAPFKHNSIFATLGLILEFSPSWKSVKTLLAGYGHRMTLLWSTS